MLISDIQEQINNKFPKVVLEAQPTALIIPKNAFLDIARFLKDELGFENCHCITAVDRKDRIEVVYHLYSTLQRLMVTLKVVLPLDDLNIESVVSLWKSANWLERETYDLFGVRFLNHPDLRRIMNPDNWTDFPLRKDFKRADFIPRPASSGLKG